MLIDFIYDIFLVTSIMLAAAGLTWGFCKYLCPNCLKKRKGK